MRGKRILSAVHSLLLSAGLCACAVRHADDFGEEYLPDPSAATPANTSALTFPQNNENPLPPQRSLATPYPMKGTAANDEVRSQQSAYGQREARNAADPVLELQKRIVAEDPANDNEKLKLASLLALDGQPAEAETVMTGMLKRSHAFLPFFESFLYRMLGEHEAVSQRIDRILQDAALIEGFKIERSVLCTRISGYRRYEQNAVGVVSGGSLIALYVEPKNFVLKEENGTYKLWLRYTWTLYNDRMEEIPIPEWRNAKPSDREDQLTLQGPIREFYQSFLLPLPVNLNIGDYRVKVTVEDANQNRTDSRYVPFRVPPMMGK